MYCCAHCVLNEGHRSCRSLRTTLATHNAVKGLLKFIKIVRIFAASQYFARWNFSSWDLTYCKCTAKEKKKVYTKTNLEFAFKNILYNCLTLECDSKKGFIQLFHLCLWVLAQPCLSNYSIPIDLSLLLLNPLFFSAGSFIPCKNSIFWLKMYPSS